jgi:hypothetical protein
LFVFSLLPLYFAFSYPTTSADTIFFLYGNAAVVLGLFVQTMIEQLFRMPKSDMSTLLWSAARLITVQKIAFFIACAGVAWITYNYFVPEYMKATASRAMRVASWLVPARPYGWDLITEGLSAEVVQGSAVVSGQRIVRLVAVGPDRHTVGERFGGLASNGVYRVVAWVKAQRGVRVMIEARDSVDPNTGKPSNSGVAKFDLGGHSVINSNGDILASGVEAASDNWVKVWVDLRSRDGKIFALIGLLEGRNNEHIFEAAD